MTRRSFAVFWPWRWFWKGARGPRPPSRAACSVRPCALNACVQGVHRYNIHGIEGLKSRKSPGAAPSLTEAQKAELRALIVKGPDLAVHKVVRWRCLDLQAEVARRFDVTVHESTIGKWLHQMRLTRQQPRPYHPKKIPEAEEAFKKTSRLC